MTKTPIIASDVAKRTVYAQPSQVTRKKGFNPRFDFGDIKGLEDLIVAQGFHPHKPLLVKRVGPDAFELVDGDRRLTAVENLIKKGHQFPEGIPLAIVAKDTDEAGLLLMAYTANEGSKTFNPLEEANTFKRLRDECKLTLKQIQERTGKSGTHINKALALLEADSSVTQAVEDGSVSATLAKQIAVKAKGDKGKQKEMVAKAQAGGKQGKKAVKEEAERMTRRRPNGVKPVVIKPLGQAQMEELEAKMSALFSKAFKSLGYESMEAVRVEISKDDSLSLAYLMGTAQALQAALGHKIKLEV